MRAFPSSAIEDEFGGMTLREWFAGQALAEAMRMVRETPGLPLQGMCAEDTAADIAYGFADAMMAERDKP